MTESFQFGPLRTALTICEVTYSPARISQGGCSSVSTPWPGPANIGPAAVSTWLCMNEGSINDTWGRVPPAASWKKLLAGGLYDFIRTVLKIWRTWAERKAIWLPRKIGEVGKSSA